VRENVRLRLTLSGMAFCCVPWTPPPLHVSVCQAPSDSSFCRCRGMCPAHIGEAAACEGSAHDMAWLSQQPIFTCTVSMPGVVNKNEVQSQVFNIFCL